MNPTLVVIPTYNESENINQMMFQLTREISEIDVLVVDDNSPDGTRNIVERFQRHEPRVNLLVREKKDGLAGAYIAGLSWGISRGYQNLIEMDADFSHRPVDVPKLLQGLTTADVAVGCRYVQGGAISGWSMLRQGISRGGNLYAQKILGLPIMDLTGGFNAWKRQVLEKIDLSTVRSRGYAFQVELKYRAHRAGFKIVEVPIHFENRRLGKSKFSSNIIWEAAFRVLELKRST